MNCKGCRWNNGGVCENRQSIHYDDLWRDGCKLRRPPLTLLERHRKEQRRRRAVVNAYIDRQARKTGALPAGRSSDRSGAACCEVDLPGRRPQAGRMENHQTRHRQSAESPQGHYDAVALLAGRLPGVQRDRREVLGESLRDLYQRDQPEHAQRIGQHPEILPHCCGASGGSAPGCRQIARLCRDLCRLCC